MISFQLNGETRQIETGKNLADLIEQLELTGKRIAVELNQEIIPRAEYVSTLIQAEDNIEIVHAIGGG